MLSNGLKLKINFKANICNRSNSHRDQNTVSAPFSAKVAIIVNGLLLCYYQLNNGILTRLYFDF